MPGLQINIDGVLGIIKTVSGGRTLVDFNNPLSGRDLVYTIKVNKKIDDDKEKIEGYIKLSIGFKNVNAELKEGKATIKVDKEVPEDVQNELIENIKNLIKSVKSAEFIVEKEEKESKS